ncbi:MULTISPECIES: DUF6879 family protein [unclassified Pseudonocardia]|nr:DUF6879 family protein [Pseudonocardia sp. Ae707_Ps1]OLM16099.1 hypothetical protein Ae707Ps1_0357 [Pseudonocardia sp. Ae707_Ps1]
MTVDRWVPQDDDWLANVWDQVSRGKYFGRVRLVGYPLTDYTRFQFLY